VRGRQSAQSAAPLQASSNQWLMGPAQRFRRRGWVQFSSLRPGTLSNAAVLFVTSVSPEARACAAMNKSLAPIITLRRFRSARISA